MNCPPWTAEWASPLQKDKCGLGPQGARGCWPWPVGTVSSDKSPNSNGASDLPAPLLGQGCSKSREGVPGEGLDGLILPGLTWIFQLPSIIRWGYPWDTLPARVQTLFRSYRDFVHSSSQIPQTTTWQQNLPLHLGPLERNMLCVVLGSLLLN